jgi:hypothetical protein
MKSGKVLAIAHAIIFVGPFLCRLANFFNLWTLKRILLSLLAAVIFASCSPPTGLNNAATDWAIVKGAVWVNKSSWTRDAITQKIIYGKAFQSNLWQQAATDRETTIYPVRLVLPGHRNDSEGEHNGNYTWTTYFFQNAFDTWEHVRETEESPPGWGLPPS